MSSVQKSQPPTSDELYPRLRRNIVYLAGGTGAAALFNMIAVAFNARALSAQEFGLLVLLQTSALILRGLISFGTQQPVIHLGAAAFAEGDSPRLGRVIGLCLLFDLAGAAASAALAFALILLAGEWTGITAGERSHASLFAVALLFTGYLSSNGIFRLLNRFGLLSVIQAGSAAALVVLSAIFYFVRAPFETYVWAWAGYMALSVQLQLWIALWLIRRRGVAISFRIGALPRPDRRKVVDYCWSTWANGAVEATRFHGDSLLVAALASIEAVGIYNVAKQVAGVLRKGTDIYASAAFPEVAALAVDGDIEGARRLRWRMVLAGGVVGIAGLAAMAVIGRPLLGYAFGPLFAAGYGALLLLVAGAGLQLISHPLAVYVQVFLSPGRLFSIYLAALALYAAATPFGIASFGITGAALGQVLFSATVIALSTLVLRRVLRPPPPA